MVSQFPAGRACQQAQGTGNQFPLKSNTKADTIDSYQEQNLYWEARRSSRLLVRLHTTVTLATDQFKPE